jgi:hypothetical protein
MKLWAVTFVIGERTVERGSDIGGRSIDMGAKGCS